MFGSVYNDLLFNVFLDSFYFYVYDLYEMRTKY